ncbi:MAG TPA: CAP domain-containing protein [Rubrobacteraceae bacterium]|nr:CAP domain-containing protein [Rubrobacteraceae bacterium]
MDFLRSINEYRENNGLPALILSDALAVASERHDEDMARYNFFAHETLGSSYFPIHSEP